MWHADSSTESCWYQLWGNIVNIAIWLVLLCCVLLYCYSYPLWCEHTTADRAKTIKTTATINESETDKLIRQLREENAKLLEMIKNGQVQFTAPVGVSDEGIVFDCGIEYLVYIMVHCRGGSYEEGDGRRACSFTGTKSSGDDKHGNVMASTTTRIRTEDYSSKSSPPGSLWHYTTLV